MIINCKIHFAGHLPIYQNMAEVVTNYADDAQTLYGDVKEKIGECSVCVKSYV